MKLRTAMSAMLVTLGMIALYLCYNTHEKQGKKALGPKQPTAPVASETYDKSLGFCSLMHECTIDALSVEGSLPSWLHGTLLRNGPGQFELNGNAFSQFFDGFAMVHRFTFKNGTVGYANKFIKTEYRTKALKNGKISNTFQETEKSSWFSNIGKLFAKKPMYDNNNAHITKIGNDFVAITETPYPVAFDPNTLETLGRISFDDKLDGHLCTAHPIIDPETNESFNVLTQYGKTSYYQIYKMAPGSKKRTIVASLPTKHPSYIHSFGLTKNYIALILMPFTVNPFDLMFSNKAFIDNFVWKPEEKTQVIIVERKTGKQIGTYTTAPFFFFHTANSY